MKEFVKEYIKLIADKPELVEVEEEVEDNVVRLFVYLSDIDMGKAIGKDGNMINAIKTFVYGCKAKIGVTYKVQIFDINDKG